MRKILVSIFCICLTFSLQADAVLTGYVKNAVSRVIDFKVRTFEFPDWDVVHSARLNDLGFFEIAIPLESSQVVEVVYARNFTEIFLDPGDNLHIEFDANSFEYSMQFSGQGGANNRFWQKFRRTFPEESNPLKLTGYRKGIVHYQVESNLDKLMRRLGQSAFMNEMERSKLRKLSELDSYQASYADLSSSFSNFIWADIQYDWAYKLMVYGYTFGQLHQVTPSFWDFVYEAPVSSPESLNNRNYRKFLRGYLNYKFDSSGSQGNPYAGQYDLAESLLLDETRAYFQSFILVKGFKKEQFLPLIDPYSRFLTSNSIPLYDQIVVESFSEANRYAVGSPAPEFTLSDMSGQPVSLADFRGKIIYLDFWASWCRPCITKIEMVKTIKRNLNPEEVVFIHLSVEKDANRWIDQVSFRNIQGVNIHVPEGLDSEVLKSYNVKAIPEYFIIDKYGNFAQKPVKSDALTLQSHIEDLLRRP